MNDGDSYSECSAAGGLSRNKRTLYSKNQVSISGSGRDFGLRNNFHTGNGAYPASYRGLLPRE